MSSGLAESQLNEYEEKLSISTKFGVDMSIVAEDFFLRRCFINLFIDFRNIGLSK
ncbi:hypothetical protein D3C85_1871060 [compost metagenome]